MPPLTCPYDQTENPAHALVCLKCQRKLSLVVVGAVFAGSYRVLASMGADELGFHYRVEETSTHVARILREIVPSGPSPREQLLAFGEVARRLIRERPKSLVATVDYFSQGLVSHGLRYYAVQEVPPSAPTLQELLKTNNRLSEEEARGLFLRTLAGLKELYSTVPPLYLGNLDPSTVLLSQPGQPLFLESHYLTDPALGISPTSPEEAFRKDVDGCARLVVSSLAGKIVPTAENLVFACTLDWLLSSTSKKPRLVSEVEQFWEWIENALAHMKSSSPAKAVHYLKLALQLSGSRVVEAALQKAEKAASALPTTQAPSPAPSENKPKSELPQTQTRSTAVPPAPVPAKPDTPALPTPHGALPTPQAIPTQTSTATATVAPPLVAVVHTEKPAVNMAQRKKQNAAMRSLGPSSSVQRPAVQIPYLRKRLIWVAGPLLAVAAVLAMWFWSNNRSLKNEFDSAVATGHLFTPPSKNAYELYQQAARSNPNSDEVKNMGEAVKQPLQDYIGKQFSRWHDNYDLPSDQRAELAKAADWLAILSPDDSTNQGRKEYLHAQVSYSQGNYEDALAGFQRAVQQVPNWDLANMGLGDSCLALKRYYHAQHYYSLAKDSSPNWPWPARKLQQVQPFLPAHDSQPVSPSPSPAKQVEIKYFGCDRPNIHKGEQLPLRWEVVNAKSIHIVGLGAQPIPVPQSGARSFIFQGVTGDLVLEAEGEGAKNVTSARQHVDLLDSHPADRPPRNDSFKYTVRPTLIGSCTVWLVEWPASRATTSWVESDSGRVQEDSPGSVVLRRPGHYQVKISGPGGTISHPFTIAVPPGVKPCN